MKAFEESIFGPMVPDFLHGAPPTGACAAFIKESRMKFVNARELDRKSGCTRGEGHPSKTIDRGYGEDIRRLPSPIRDSISRCSFSRRVFKPP